MEHSEISLSELKEQFRTLSLRELSVEAVQLAQQIEDNPVEDNEGSLDEILQEYLKEATTEKIDGYCFYADHLQSEIELWKQKRANLSAMCDKVIESLERKLNALERSLLYLHAQKLISKEIQGKYRGIEIRTSQPKVEVLIPESELPQEYQIILSKADKKAILSAYKRGEDISQFAEISQGLHVRFKTLSSGRKR